jgi:hypothetical protein
MPIVAIIWVFEAIHGRIKGDAPFFSALGPVGANTLPVDGATSPRKQKPFLSNRAKTYSQHFPEIPNDDGLQGPGPQNMMVQSGQEGRVEAIVVDNPALVQKVEDLTTKIAELTALIMAQQGIAETEEL